MRCTVWEVVAFEFFLYERITPIKTTQYFDLAILFFSLRTLLSEADALAT